jgi:septation ring formation regulator EzrA
MSDTPDERIIKLRSQYESMRIALEHRDEQYADLEAKNKELEAALKTVQQYWGRINEKGLVATIKDLEAENKELVAFVRYVSEIDPREVSDPDNENPLSMGELQWGAKELLKQEGGENHG